MKTNRYYDDLRSYLTPGKALLILGARQVGKTTLVKDYLTNCLFKYRYDSGEDVQIQDVLGSQNLSRILEFAAGYDLVVIDEAHKIEGIGLGLKLLVDNKPDCIVIATGSSSFELAGQVGEPLTGRKRTLQLYPIANLELKQEVNNFDLKFRLEEFLVYGSYPEVVTTIDKKDKVSLLNELMGSFLLKDILELVNIRNSKTLLSLLRLLAFQIGSEVSFHELGKKLGLDSKTVARYLDILEKSFVIFSLGGYSNNLHNEISKKQKYFFYDNGIRNAIVSNYNHLELRDDVEQLWINFLVMERLKKQKYTGIFSNNFFWRTWERHEVDWVEEREGKLFVFEFKWGKGKVKGFKKFKETYPESECKIIDQTNYLDFIT